MKELETEQNKKITPIETDLETPATIPKKGKEKMEKVAFCPINHERLKKTEIQIKI